MNFISRLLGRQLRVVTKFMSKSVSRFLFSLILLFVALIGWNSQAIAQSYDGYAAFPYAYQAYDSCLVNGPQWITSNYASSDYIIYSSCEAGWYQGFSGYHFKFIITNPIYAGYNKLTDRWSTYGQNTGDFSSSKNLGCLCNRAGNSPFIGNPINIATGNKYEEENDFSQGDLSFVRRYNSDPTTRSSTMGYTWLSSYDRSISVIFSDEVALLRPDGQFLIFNKKNGFWTSSSGRDVDDVLTEIDNPDGSLASWRLFVADAREYEDYTASGQLQSISDESRVLVSLAYTDGTQKSSTGSELPSELLNTVVDAHGLSLTFHYDGNARIIAVSLPDGGMLQYSYSNNLLSSVTYADGSTRQYLYDESAYSAAGSGIGKLTGIIDESGARFATYGYQSDGRAISTQHSGGADLYTLSYSQTGSGTHTVTYPLGQKSTATFIAPQGTALIQSMSALCGSQCNQQYQSLSLDGNGYPASYTDFNNNLTTTQYDVNGLLDQQVDGSGTPSQRTTNTTWNTALRVPLTRTVLDATGRPVASAAWIYNASGKILARCDVDPANTTAAGYSCNNTGSVPIGVRRSTYTYCDALGANCPLLGLLLTSTGPRTDLTQTNTYSYYTTSGATNCGTPGGACYQPGDLYQVTDALGHVTTYASYDGAGRVTRITDANGVNTDMTYTPRGWLASRSVGGATTTFTYMPYGEVKTITDPDGIVTTFGYDSAHRLTDITDAQGNDLHYTLDAAGNKTAEQISTAAGTVVHSLSRNYNALGQLTAVIDGLKQTVFNAGYSDSYDANGNLTHSADGLGVQRQQNYDALNRLQSTLDNYSGTDTATANTTTTVSQDALDRVASVTDPSGLVTSYTHDGLGDVTTVQSPDTGTSTDTFDAAGNRLTHTDAKGTVATSTYDALNRLTSTSYTDTTANVTYTYDEANSVTDCAVSAPIGRLTRIVERAVTTTYCYDARGNVIQKNQVTSAQTDTTRYTYTPADRLATVTTPDKTVISYARNTNGQIGSIKVTPSGASAATTVVSATTWLPFGPISSFTLGNGQRVTRTYDANYRVTDITSPAFTLHLARDLMGDVSAIGTAAGANPASETYQYDPLYRLGSVTEANGSVLESYTYNPTGDRLSKTAPGLATGAYLYTSSTHQLQSIGNVAQASDANGNTTGSVMGGGTYGFAYNARNRLSLAQLNGATVGTYTYNALGQRIGKVTTATERFAYDQSSHLLAEYGATNRDYLWMDDVPVAVVDNAINGSVTTSTINYITADQLNTPRAVTNSAGAVIWSWAYQGNPFGEQQPTSTTGYVLNLRYPGQYYDAETDTNYNLFRTFRPAIGRYLQADPLGQVAGPSLFAYVGNNPLNLVDSLGLQAEEVPAEETPEEEWARNPGLGPNEALSLKPATEQEQEAAEGECPANPKSWSAARRAFWQKEAMNHPYDYSPDDLNRMERGLPPLHPELGVPKELHHIIPQRDGGSHDPSNLMPVWPWEHAEIDPYRYYNGPMPSNGGGK